MVNDFTEDGSPATVRSLIGSQAACRTGFFSWLPEAMVYVLRSMLLPTCSLMTTQVSLLVCLPLLL